MSEIPFQPTAGSWRAPKFVVQGFPDDAPETQALLQAHQVTLRQFYLQQAQNHALGQVDYASTQGDFGDHQIRYTNNQGHETVFLAVHPVKVAEVLEEHPGGEWWDGAVVELSVDLQNISWAYFSAFVISPVLQQLTPDMNSFNEVRGVARDQTTWPPDYATLKDRLVVAYPDYGNTADFVTSADTALQKSSLRVDLRTLRGVQMVAVDLYAGCDPTSADVTPTVTHTTIVASTTLTYGASFASDRKAFYAPFANRGTPGDYDSWVFGWGNQVYGPYGFLIFEEEWTPAETQLSGGSPPADGDQFLEQAIRTTHTATEIPPLLLLVGGTLRGTMFKTSLPDDWSERDGSYNSFRQWEQKAIYPRRWPLRVLGENINIPAIDSLPSPEVWNHFGMAWLGRVTMDLQHGNISFKPA